MKMNIQRVQARIIDCLQEGFYVTDGELVAKNFNPRWLSSREIAGSLQAQLGILLPEVSCRNWGEYVDLLSRAACRQGVKI